MFAFISCSIHEAFISLIKMYFATSAKVQYERKIMKLVLLANASVRAHDAYRNKVSIQSSLNTQIFYSSMNCFFDRGLGQWRFCTIWVFLFMFMFGDFYADYWRKFGKEIISRVSCYGISTSSDCFKQCNWVTRAFWNL